MKRDPLAGVLFGYIFSPNLQRTNLLSLFAKPSKTEMTEMPAMAIHTSMAPYICSHNPPSEESPYILF